jgi:hypothetical protein
VDDPVRRLMIGDELFPIKKRRNEKGVVRNKWFKTIAQLFGARTLKDLIK